MIRRWIQSVRGVRGATKSLSFPSALVDVAHEVLAKEALEKGLALQELEKYGWSLVHKQKFSQKVRQKVRRLLRLSHLSHQEETDMIEEVTERFTEVAEADPHYKRWFEDS